MLNLTNRYLYEVAHTSGIEVAFRYHEMSRTDGW